MTTTYGKFGGSQSNPGVLISPTITSPVSGATIQAGTSFLFAATWTCSPGSPTGASLYLAGYGTKLFGNPAGDGTVSATVLMPGDVPIGSQNLLAKFYDSLGNEFDVTIPITITASGGISVPFASLTAHNTSSNPTYLKAGYPAFFTGRTCIGLDVNGNPIWQNIDANKYDDSLNPAGIINISKTSIKTLRPASATRDAMWMEMYWGLTSHPNFGINEFDGPTLLSHLNDMKARGYDLTIFNHYGTNCTGGPTVNNFSFPHSNGAPGDNAADIIAAQIGSVPNFNFSFGFDQSYLANYFTPAQYQGAIIALLKHCADKYFTQARFEKYNGRPIVWFWDFQRVIDAAGTNPTHVFWDQVHNAINSYCDSLGQPHPYLIGYKTAGLSAPAGQTGTYDGAFYWTGDNPYSSFHSHQNLILCAPTDWKFDGTLCFPSYPGGASGWSGGKYTDAQNGQLWLNYHSYASSYLSSGYRLDYLIQVTWDDRQEGTAVMGGIFNGLAFSSNTITGSLLKWTVTGNEATVADYTAWAVPNGSTTATLLATIPFGSPRQLDLSTVTFPAHGLNAVYVRAEGQPQVINLLSPGTNYTAP